jgi:hypothetical protein
MDHSMSLLMQERAYDEGYDQASLYSLNDGEFSSPATHRLGKAAPHTHAHAHHAYARARGYSSASNPPTLPPIPSNASSASTNTTPSKSNAQYLHSGYANRAAGGPQTPRSQRGFPSSAAMDISPTTTTADYSIAPGSPGSLVLKPEDERHLGEMLNFMGPEEML